MASVSQNSFYLISGSVIQKILAFIYFIFLARFLGPENVGKYTFAIYFVAIFAIFLDWGLNQVLIREVARDRSKTQDYLYNILAVKLICSVIIYLVIILIVNLLGYQTVTKHLVYLAAFVIVLDSLYNTVYAALRGFQNLKYESIGLSAYQLIVLALGLLVLYLRLPLPYLILPLVVAATLNLIYAIAILRNKYQIKFVWRFDQKFIKKLIKITIPFFLAGLFGTVFSYIDVVLLSKLGGDRYVGFYSAASKMQAGLRILPVAFATALYPAACFYFEKDKKELERIVERSIFYLILFGLPVIVGLWVLSDKAIMILYGQKFMAAVPALKIISWSIFFVFLDYIFFAILNACGKEKQNVINRAVAMISIVILNLILIPPLKHVGSAIAFTFSFALLALVGGWMSYKAIKFSIKKILRRFFQVLLVSLAMGLVISLLKSAIHLIPLICLGGLIYAMGVWLMGLISKDDIQYVRNIMGALKLSRLK